MDVGDSMADRVGGIDRQSEGRNEGIGDYGTCWEGGC